MLYFPLADTSLSLSAPELMVLWISKLKGKGEPRIPAEFCLVSCRRNSKSLMKGHRDEHASGVLRGSDLRPNLALSQVCQFRLTLASAGFSFCFCELEMAI